MGKSFTDEDIAEESAAADTAAPEEAWDDAEVEKSETLPNFLKASRKVLSGLMTNPSITSMEGLPNIFCGFSTLILHYYNFFLII